MSTVLYSNFLLLIQFHRDSIIKFNRQNSLISDCLPLNIKALQSFKILGNVYPQAQLHIPEDQAKCIGYPICKHLVLQ